MCDLKKILEGQETMDRLDSSLQLDNSLIQQSIADAWKSNICLN